MPPPTTRTACRTTAPSLRLSDSPAITMSREEIRSCSPAYLNVANGLVTRDAEFEQPRPWDDMPPRVGQDRYPAWCKVVAEAQAMHIPFQIESGKPYPIRAMLAFGLNHRMWPGSDFMEASLQKLDFLVDVDIFMTDSARLADLVLPACTSFERSELKFYAEQYVIWTQPAIRPQWESRSDTDIIFDLAPRMVPEDALMQKGYEACIDWMLEPTKLTVEELKKYPARLCGPGREDAALPQIRKARLCNAFREDGIYLHDPGGSGAGCSSDLHGARAEPAIDARGCKGLSSYPHHRCPASDVCPFENLPPGLDAQPSARPHGGHEPAGRERSRHRSRRLGQPRPRRGVP